MMKAVRGIYKNGQVSLLEAPADLLEGEVIVTFIEGEDKVVREAIDENTQMITFGMFSNGAEQFTLADFEEAEFHGGLDELGRS